MSIPYAQWEREVILANRFQPRAQRFFAVALPHRTFASIKEYARRTCIPLQSFRHFSPQEDDVLRRHHPNYAKAAALLPGRTVQALKDRARYLGIALRKKRWTEAAEEALAKLATIHTDSEIGIILGRTTHSVLNQRHRMGIRHRYALPSGGAPIFEDIGVEAHRRGVRLGTLCVGLNTPKLRRRERGQMPTLHSVVKAFGGELYAKWED